MKKILLTLMAATVVLAMTAFSATPVYAEGAQGGKRYQIRERIKEQCMDKIDAARQAMIDKAKAAARAAFKAALEGIEKPTRTDYGKARAAAKKAFMASIEESRKAARERIRERIKELREKRQENKKND